MAKNAKKKNNHSAQRNAQKQPLTTAEIKEQKRRRNTAAKKNRGSIKDYFKGVRTEMKKVVWPTKKELGSYTIVVIITCAIFALGFWLIDTGFLAALKQVLGITLS